MLYLLIKFLWINNNRCLVTKYHCREIITRCLQFHLQKNNIYVSKNDQTVHFFMKCIKLPNIVYLFYLFQSLFITGVYAEIISIMLQVSLWLFMNFLTTYVRILIASRCTGSRLSECYLSVRVWVKFEVITSSTENLVSLNCDAAIFFTANNVDSSIASRSQINEKNSQLKLPRKFASTKPVRVQPQNRLYSINYWSAKNTDTQICNSRPRIAQK